MNTETEVGLHEWLGGDSFHCRVEGDVGCF